MRIYFNHRRVADITISICICAFLFYPPAKILIVFTTPQNEALSDLLLATATSSASLLGFVLAANTFLISHIQHDRLSLIRQSGGFRQLVDIMRSSLWRLLTLTIYSGAGVLIDSSWEIPMLVGLTFLFVFSVISISTLIWSTMAILSIPLEPPKV